MNIVLSRKPNLILPGAYRVGSFNEALELIEEKPEENIDFKKSYVIGGSSVYEEAFGSGLVVPKKGGVISGAALPGADSLKIGDYN